MLLKATNKNKSLQLAAKHSYVISQFSTQLIFEIYVIISQLYVGKKYDYLILDDNQRLMHIIFEMLFNFSLKYKSS